MMKIGILGGTFDPPHKAHLQIAERAIKQFDLDKVLFIPSGNPWQKKYATSFIHRFEMTKILIEGSNKFEISDIEKSEDIPSYTFDTLTKLNHKKDNLYFILGSDTAMNIKTWNNYKKLSELTNFLIALRKEDSVNNLNENFPFDYELIDGEKLDLSSTSLSEKLQDNLLVEEDITSKVLNYINSYSLYGIFLFSSSISSSNSLSFPTTFDSISSIFSISSSNSSSFSKTSSLV